MAANALANIRRFDQLVKYLRDELDWPIQSADFDDLTFDFTPEELGIDSRNAAKIQEIKRLRPLSPNQPWGVFFIKFEPKRLPIVALRRILSSFALKRRASANPADRRAWAAEDLLFISNYGGDGDDRKITFAHFSVYSTINLPNSAGELANVSAPKLAMRALKLGSASPALISLLSFSMISVGVFLGAPIPCQPVAS